MPLDPFDLPSDSRQPAEKRGVGAGVYVAAGVAAEVWTTVLEGFDLEVGGLLLGSIEGDVRIDAVKPLLIEHRYGPSFWLTSVDVEKWTQAIIEITATGQKEVIGHFRSQQVGGGQIRDTDVADSDHAVADLLHVPEPVLLLIPAGGRNSGESFLYRRVNGNWIPLLRCPLEDIPAIPPPVADPVEAPVAPVPAAPRPAVTLLRRRLLAASAVGVVAAAVLLAGLSLWRRPPPPAGKETPIGLAANISKGGITVLWNHGSSLVRQSTSGILLVQDGSQRRQISLSRDELLSGSVFYVPVTGRVEFRIQVYRDRDHYRAESLSVASGVAVPSPVVQAALPSRPPRREPPREPASAGTTPDVEPVAPGIGTSARVVTPAAVPPALPPTRPPAAEPVLPSPPPVSAAAAPANAADTLQRLSSILTSSSAPPPPAPSLSFVAAVPVRKITPAIPANLRALVKDDVTVDVKVVIDAFGNVLSATPLGASTAAQKILAPQAVQAALLWRFEPARRNGLKVNSESLLKFDFQRR